MDRDLFIVIESNVLVVAKSGKQFFHLVVLITVYAVVILAPIGKNMW
jgi:hypothetical protein